MHDEDEMRPGLEGESTEQRIRRLADKFLGRPPEQVRQDEEYRSLTTNELLLLAAEYRRRAP
jgi:hypothetical protein